MPITVIDEQTALVVIDLQHGIVARPTVHPAANVIAKCADLATTFRSGARPVVLVHVGWSADHGDALATRTQEPARLHRPLPADFTQYVSELAADPQRDIFIRKRQWGTFYGTDLDLQLRRRGITNIVLCGIATSIGVESTARDAFERGYNLTFAADAMTDLNIDAHERALAIIFPRLGEIGTTAEIIANLPAATGARSSLVR